MNYGLTFEELSKVFANVAKLEKAYEEYERILALGLIPRHGGGIC